MSYCRMGVDDSDVYCYEHVGGYFVTWAEGRTFKSDTIRQTIKLLEELRASGNKVPQYAIDNLTQEMKKHEL